MTGEEKIRLATINIPTHLELVLLTISTYRATEVPQIFTLLAKLIQLRRKK
jgi:hypothetical protein